MSHHEHVAIRGHVGMLLFTVYLVWDRLICSLQHVRLTGLVSGTLQSPEALRLQICYQRLKFRAHAVEQSFYPPGWAISPVPKSCSSIYLQQVLFLNGSNLMYVCMHVCVLVCMCVCLYVYVCICVSMRTCFVLELPLRVFGLIWCSGDRQIWEP